MSEMTREQLLGVVRDVWTERDPVPEGLVGRMQALAASEVAATGLDLDFELMLLVERSTELAGARGSTAYTLQFAHGDVALLVRAAVAEEDGETARLDGWLAPAEEMTVRASRIDDAEAAWETDVDARGRFEFRDLPAGLFRLWLTPHAPGLTGFGTPAFEI